VLSNLRLARLYPTGNHIEDRLFRPCQWRAGSGVIFKIADSSSMASPATRRRPSSRHPTGTRRGNPRLAVPSSVSSMDRFRGPNHGTPRSCGAQVRPDHVPALGRVLSPMLWFPRRAARSSVNTDDLQEDAWGRSFGRLQRPHPRLHPRTRQGARLRQRLRAQYPGIIQAVSGTPLRGDEWRRPGSISAPAMPRASTARVRRKCRPAPARDRQDHHACRATQWQIDVVGMDERAGITCERDVARTTGAT
jgi:hypothetical protein